MKLRAILAAGLGGLALASAAAGPAAAAYVANYAAWSKLTDREKDAYVRGLNDGSSVIDTGAAANAVQAAMVRGRTQCLNREQVTSRMLVALIDTQYQNDLSARDLPPMTLYWRETYRICRQDIQAAVDAAVPKPQGSDQK